MISILPTYNKKFRAFGWVQDGGNLRSLCDIVAIFDCNSKKYNDLIIKLIPKLVLKEDGKQEMIEFLKVSPVKLPYALLVGSAFTPRANSRCNGIIQAAIKGQRRDFIVDWAADNFLRWAHCLGFVKFDYEMDCFQITDSGLELVKARTSGKMLNSTERDLLTTAMLAYPPAIRILSLLNGEETHLTKFEIGRQLGFIGEDGFKSLPQSILIRTLSNMNNKKEKNKIKADWEGSSDKYARMIAKWLESLGLIEQAKKEISVGGGDKTYTETIGQSYIITAQGVTALNRAAGKAKHSIIPKNICFEMLATKGSDREYLRTRRAFIVKYLSEHKGCIPIETLKEYLAVNNINDTIETIYDDINELINIGLFIEKSKDGIIWKDVVNDFIIPIPEKLIKSTVGEEKEKIRSQIKVLSHEYLALMDLAYDSKQNRLFEMKTLELLVEECKYKGMHLGGSRKPDGIIYTMDTESNYGVIVDTKAYSSGYSLPIGQADEMGRYIYENQVRDTKVNPNKWWENFEENIVDFYFLFI